MTLKRILITGGSGFIGRALAKKLVSQGFGVRSFDLKPPSKALEGVETVLGDLHGEELKPALQGCDAVVHLAAVVQTHGPRSLFERVNVEGTRRVAELAKEQGVPRCVFSSSVAVFDFAIGYDNADEETPTGGSLGHYGQSKLKAERILRALRDDRFSATIIRPGLLPYGPNDRAGSFALLQSIEKQQPMLINGGHAVLSTSYIENLADGLALCSTHPAARNETFHLVDDGAPTWLQLVTTAAEMLGVNPNTKNTPRWLALTAANACEATWKLLRKMSAPPVSRYAVDLVSRPLHFSSEKAKDRLGYQPRIELEEGLRRSIDWYRTLAA